MGLECKNGSTVLDVVPSAAMPDVTQMPTILHNNTNTKIDHCERTDSSCCAATILTIVEELAQEVVR